MNTNVNKNVVCVKDIPSNVIEEAIFILKKENFGSKNKKINLLREEIILKESEELVKEYTEKFIKNEMEKQEEKRKINNEKIKLVLVSLLIVGVFYLFSILV